MKTIFALGRYLPWESLTVAFNDETGTEIRGAISGQVEGSPGYVPVFDTLAALRAQFPDEDYAELRMGTKEEYEAEEAERQKELARRMIIIPPAPRSNRPL
jgi:hypothetical protein